MSKWNINASDNKIRNDALKSYILMIVQRPPIKVKSKVYTHISVTIMPNL